ncbi:DUF3131 domain-containing protein [Mesorhizobium sp. WSM4976]|uniref:DUF3131 domain-containing protein n=1 Tax=Mesorhizobium sp. WSM4976 TaxID=3038549 RepID=UPI002415C8E8|nr:DUF3131 domain-containing protein [Mesorhizobium sp. WSM4976]
MTRRVLLQSLCAGAIVTPILKLRLANAAQRPVPFALICDASASGSAGRKAQLALETLGGRNIPSGLLLPAMSFGGEDSHEDIHGAAAALGRTYGGLVELVAFLPGIEAERPYFQMRWASEAQDRLARLLPEDHGVRHAITLACGQLADELSLAGVRAGGFRSALLMPQKDQPTEFAQTGNGVMQISGGVRLTSLSALEGARGAILEAIARDDVVVLYLSINDLAQFADDQISSLSSSLADFLSAQADAGRINMILPSEFFFRSEDFARYVALFIDLQDASPPDTQAVSELLSDLAKTAVPFSYSGANGPAISDAGVKPQSLQCQALESDLGAPAWQELRARVARILAIENHDNASIQTCAVSHQDKPPFEDMRTVGINVLASIAGDRDGFAGLDRNGLLRIPATYTVDASRLGDGVEAAQEIAKRIGDQRDALVTVRTTASADSGTRMQIAGMLAELAKHPGNVAVDVEQLGQGVIAQDGIFELLGRSDALVSLAVGTHQDIDASERAALLQDAELAWQYFARMSDKNTGLAPASAQLSGKTVVPYTMVTMWDVASQIFATGCARAVGLIEDAEFSQRTARILKHLPVTTIGGLRLPQASISTRGGGGFDNNFSASDVGRLLAALKYLGREPGFEKEIDELVDRWDLKDTISDGRLHDVDDGVQKEYFNSNYTHYATRGFALWGMEAQSPYDARSMADLDGRMRFLEQVADLGPIGTEPHVLEGVELGHSEPSRMIADVLFTAQLDAYRTSGTLVCVSEGSIDRDPWFVYEGFQLGDEENPWTAKTVLDRREDDTPSFRNSVMMVNTKAAFLWQAIRPHPYSARLLSHVRKSARIPGLGFASGIYSATGKPTAGYSDLNTNGMILEAVAFMLNGHKPLV